MRTKLTANGANEKAVLAYIEANASENLVQRINSGTKTLEGCWKFIVAEARKKAVKGCACIEDKVVFGWAIHYFEEDSIEEGKTYAETGVAAGSETSSDAPKKEEKPKAAEKPKKAKAQCNDQMSLLDLFG